MNIDISKLTPSDAESFFIFIKNQNENDHFLFTRWKNYLNSDEKLKNLVEKECNLPEKEGFRIVARDSNGKICGYGLIDFFIQPEKQHVSAVGTIVDKEFRGQGIGKQLLQEEINLSKSKNILKVRASAHEHNIQSVNLHKSLGFEVEGKFVAEEFNEKYLTVVSMALFLEPSITK